MFGASNPFGQGSSSSNPFGIQTQSLFGQNNNATIGASSPIGAQTGASSPFGASSQGFGTSSTPSFGHSASPFAGCTPDAWSSTSTPKNYPRCEDYEQGHKGSLVMPYESTESGTGTVLLSISAMAIYKGKSHEEIRWEDYQQGHKDKNNGDVGDAHLVKAIEKLKVAYENDGGNERS